MLINSENTKIAVSVSSRACLWHDEYIYHFYKSNVHAGIFISCLQILCTDLPLMFVYQVLLPVQASWLLIWAWKISALVWAKKNVMDFMPFKEDINLHQQQHSFCFYGQYGHSVLVQIKKELLEWISWHPLIAFFSSYSGVALVYKKGILD